jgi:hypothetical protein
MINCASDKQGNIESRGGSRGPRGHHFTAEPKAQKERERGREKGTKRERERERERDREI